MTLPKSTLQPRREPRARIEVSSQGSGGWLIVVNGAAIESLARKVDAVDCAVELCQWRMDVGLQSQLRVRTMAGKFEFERTYPDTTPRRKG